MGGSMGKGVIVVLMLCLFSVGARADTVGSIIGESPVASVSFVVTCGVGSTKLVFGVRGISQVDEPSYSIQLQVSKGGSSQTVIDPLSNDFPTPSAFGEISGGVGEYSAVFSKNPQAVGRVVFNGEFHCVDGVNAHTDTFISEAVPYDPPLPPTPTPPNPIPTLSEWAQIMMMLAMIATAGFHGWRMKQR